MTNLEPARGNATAETRYVFDNAADATRRRFTGLPLVFDPGTIRHLSERGLASGWQCLEVGAGGGSIAAWLAERVGPSGSVLATDIDTRFLEQLRVPNLRVQRHDITSDPLPDSRFDLVHARCVLIHLPAPDAALARMAAALKPGGWLVIEDFDGLSVRADPSLDPAEVPLKAREAMIELIQRRGLDLLYGRRVPAQLRALGFEEIGAEGRVFRWHGGSPGASVDRANIEQLREPMLSAGLLTQAEFEADLARLEDPGFAYPSPTLWATWGRRPGRS